MKSFVIQPTTNELPPGQWIALCMGSVLALSVYYFNYGTTFDEGQIEGASSFTMLLRAFSVGLIVWSLRPFYFRFDSLTTLVMLYLVSAISFLSAIGISGEANDILFFNTLLQLPVLISLSATTREIKYARWLRFIGCVLALQVIVDAVIWSTGASLWLSEAFIGGVGNPSSFGLLCGLMVAFFLFHPQAGRLRWTFVLVLAVGVVMSKSLFAVIALSLINIAWMFSNWRRMVLSLVASGAVAIGIASLLYNTDFSQFDFVEHKLKAVGALIGLVEYDVESSASVATRVAIHEQTFAAIAQDPLRLVYGHLEGKQYWPMDSQLLTYLGSFGLIVLIGFVILNIRWLRCSIRDRYKNGGFSFWVLIIFVLIFFTNRILDYFPMAIVYFILISMATQTRRR